MFDKQHSDTESTRCNISSKYTSKDVSPDASTLKTKIGHFKLKSNTLHWLIKTPRYVWTTR